MSAMPKLDISYHDSACITAKGITFSHPLLATYCDFPDGALPTRYVMPKLAHINTKRENHIFFRRSTHVPEAIADTITDFVDVEAETLSLNSPAIARFFADATGFFVTYFTHGLSITKIHSEGGPCVKQNVYATVVSPDGEQFTGTNLCKNPQTVCPRDAQGMKSGEGYELCESVCQQTGHAEVNAIAKAKEKAKGGIIYLSGHLYACGGCQSAIREAGIDDIRVVNGLVGPTFCLNIE